MNASHFWVLFVSSCEVFVCLAGVIWRSEKDIVYMQIVSRTTIMDEKERERDGRATVGLVYI